MVADKPEEKDATPAMPPMGGGMIGMGGMVEWECNFTLRIARLQLCSFFYSE